MSNDSETNNQVDTEQENNDKARTDSDQTEELTKQLEAEKEAKLLAFADLDNYRKRVEKERHELVKLANMSLFRSIIDVIDDFERLVIDLDEQGKEDKIDAFKPVLDKTKGILADYSIIQIEVNEGDVFSHETMEAIGTVVVESEDKHNRVINIAQTGYKFRDTESVVRHARVIVGKLSAST